MLMTVMIASLNELTTRKLPLNRAIISDIVLWVTLLALLAWAIWFFGAALPDSRGQTFTLHFKDANEVTQGSSVRMMGIEIGVVKNVRILPDHVDITIHTYPRSLPIPSGANFTVLFTGLAGSKSVEIEVPDTPKPAIQGKPIYLVEAPIRMKDLLDSNIEITQALEQGAQNITDFFGKKEPIEELQFNIHQVNQVTTRLAGESADYQHRLREANHQVTETASRAIRMLNNTQRSAAHLVAMSNPPRMQRLLHNKIVGMRNFTAMFVSGEHGARNTAFLATHLATVNAINDRAARGLAHAQQAVLRFPLSQRLDSVSHGEDQFETMLEKADYFFMPSVIQPKLARGRQKMQAFNKQLVQLNARADQQLQQEAAHPGKPFILNKLQRKSPRGSSVPAVEAVAAADTAKSIVLADSQGRAVNRLQTHWWVQPVQVQRAAEKSSEVAIPNASSPIKPEASQGFLAQLIGSVWDAVQFFFR